MTGSFSLPTHSCATLIASRNTPFLQLLHHPRTVRCPIRFPCRTSTASCRFPPCLMGPGATSRSILLKALPDSSIRSGGHVRPVQQPAVIGSPDPLEQAVPQFAEVPIDVAKRCCAETESGHFEAALSERHHSRVPVRPPDRPPARQEQQHRDLSTAFAMAPDVRARGCAVPTHVVRCVSVSRWCQSAGCARRSAPFRSRYRAGPPARHRQGTDGDAHIGPDARSHRRPRLP